MIMQTSSFSSVEGALNWASQHFPFAATKLIREIPWSRIFELNGSAEAAYLKLVPLRQLQVLKNHAVLSHHFGSIVPETIAVNEILGLQLFRNHGGRELGSNPSEMQIRNLLSTYTKMQAEARALPEVLSTIPALQLNELLTNFLEFLKPGKVDVGTGHKVNADFFLGPEEAQEYYDVFLARKDLLNEFLKNAALLPPTLNHCDLHSENAAEKDDGSSVIYDWDDAIIGPAGLSLHAVFIGCFKITQLLSDDFAAIEDETYDRDKRLLSHYMTELDKQGYASTEILQQALPASACAGAIQALLTYANFPQQDDDYIFNINEFFVKRLDDLLNLCDYLSCSSRDKALHFAEDYQQKNILFRAGYVYRNYLTGHPNDIEIHKRLASILRQTGKWEQAISCYQAIVDHHSADAETFNGLGVAFLKYNKPVDALEQFELALSIDPDYKSAQINRDKATELLFMIDQARHPNKLPTVRISSEERNAGLYCSEKTDLASRLFKQYGALVVDNVFDTDMLQAIKSLILDKYASYFEPKDYDDCLRLGDKRHMVTLDIEGPINSPDLYDNPFITAIAKQILGEDYILGGLNMGVSLPGAENQAVHKDHTPLFYEDEEFREYTPTFAVGILIPLVQHSHTVGTTLVIKGSHKTSLKEAKSLPGQAPFLDIGSCLIIDYRVAHQGLANKSSDVVRPLLSLFFHRSWFRDCFNYKQQASIKIDSELFNQSPERLKELISWAKSEAIINPVNIVD
jgi:tetratricopeptide (TPR) repeat protein